VTEIIVALDVEDANAANALVDQLPDLTWVKVGPILFLESGPSLVRALKDRGLKVFLDLKWFDIPNTVAKAVGVAAETGVDLATVHALGGVPMIEAAAAVAKDMRLAAVTVLTSFESEEYWQTVRGESSDLALGTEAERLAARAVGAGAGAVVTSTEEIRDVRVAIGPDPWIVVPGIRPQVVVGDDQHRVGTPEEAVRAGATHLVVGRPIYQAEDPKKAFEELCEAAR
jgi:orotidine-5'-phosphate decarboxylase